MEATRRLASSCLVQSTFVIIISQAPEAVEAISKEANASAHIIATNAEPIAEAFVENQLQPRAHELADNLEPQVRVPFQSSTLLLTVLQR